MKGFALIREPGSEPLWMSLESNAQGAFRFSTFSGQIETFAILEHEVGESALAKAHSILQGADWPALDLASSHDFDSYVALIESARRACEEGALEKVVLSRCHAYPQVDLDLMETYNRLCAHYPRATVYMIYRQGQSLWMGATPECLVETQGHVVRTMSLAGTRVADSEGSWGAKEREEQHVVTRDIIHMLQVMGCKHLTIEGPTVLNAGPVEHLCSMIQGERNGSGSDEIARALHPTPAVGGLPRAQAAAFIRQREGYDRRFYAGYFGWTRAERSVFYVNLRCLEWGSDGVLCYAGGGITSKSHPEQEWQETEQKLKTLERVIFG